MTSSQGLSVSQRQDNLFSTAMIPQNCTFPGFIPNMVPHVAGTSGANVGDTQTHVPEPILQEHASISGTSLLHSYPSGSAPPHRIELLSSSTMAQHISQLSSCMTTSNGSSYAGKTPGSSQPALLQHVSTHPLAGKTIQVAPVPSKASDVKFSRLSSRNIPRKAPLRGNSGQSKPPSQDISRNISKPGQTQPSSRPETSANTATPAQKRRRVPTEKCQDTTRQSPVVLTKMGRGGKGMTKDDNQEGGNNQREEGAFRRKIKSNESKNDAARTTIPARIHREGRNVTKNFLQGTKIARSTYVPSSLLPNRTLRRRPMYDYDVPLELEGIRRALGKNQSPQSPHLPQTQANAYPFLITRPRRLERIRLPHGSPLAQ